MRNQIQIVHENKMSSYLISIIFLDRIKMMVPGKCFWVEDGTDSESGMALRLICS